MPSVRHRLRSCHRLRSHLHCGHRQTKSQTSERSQTICYYCRWYDYCQTCVRSGRLCGEWGVRHSGRFFHTNAVRSSHSNGNARDDSNHSSHNTHSDKAKASTIRNSTMDRSSTRSHTRDNSQHNTRVTTNCRRDSRPNKPERAYSRQNGSCDACTYSLPSPPCR